MYINIYIYIYVFIHSYIYTFIYLYIYLYIYITYLWFNLTTNTLEFVMAAVEKFPPPASTPATRPRRDLDDSNDYSDEGGSRGGEPPSRIRAALAARIFSYWSLMETTGI